MTQNPQQVAKEYALHTRTNVFLTGRAGTGKTTLLKEILKETDKNLAVVAPTGVAAINAGGMTIHSMFQLPITGFIPTDDPVDPTYFTNRTQLARSQRIRKERIQVLLELELLIIDEISMVRADLLDAIDTVLRRLRKNQLPFGGVQIFVIGDLFQLSPVIKNQSLNVLSNYYDSPFFFDSWVWKKCNPITIELTKIFRQEDESFIDILNNIRTGNKLEKDLSILNRRVIKEINNNDVITLTTHNAKADKINTTELNALKTKSFHLEAQVKGKFSESSYPANENILLKKGCQVMFIRNHPDGLFFNGKIGTVQDKIENEIIIQTEDDNYPIRVLPVEWKNIKYTVDPETKEVEKEDVGSFTQYPLKLAWAVTIHKSQGLTFDKVNLDLSDTFAPGQLYVALSRCRSMSGLNLTHPITNRNIIVDQRITDYYRQNIEAEISLDHLARAKDEYEDIKIKEAWKFTKLISYTEHWIDALNDADIPEIDNVIAIGDKILTSLKMMEKTGERFQSQLTVLISNFALDNSNLEPILSRCLSGTEYFNEQLYNQVLMPLEGHYDKYVIKKGVKRYIRMVESLIGDIWKKIESLYQLKYRTKSIHNNPPRYVRVRKSVVFKSSKKKEKGATYDITFELLENGNSIKEIAEKRSMAISTIEGHMLKLLQKQKISLTHIMNEARIAKIHKYAVKNQKLGITELKNKIPFETSYSELRWIRASLNSTEILDST